MVEWCLSLMPLELFSWKTLVLRADLSAAEAWSCRELNLLRLDR